MKYLNIKLLKNKKKYCNIYKWTNMTNKTVVK